MLIQPVNTLIGAFNSLDLPNAARAYINGGLALLRFQVRAIARLAAVGSLCLGLLALFAGPLLAMLFDGRYSDATVLWCWVLVGLLTLVATPTENVFYVTRRPQWLLLSRLGAAAAGCGCAVLLIPSLGAVGAVLSIASWLVAFLGASSALWFLRR